MGFFFGSFLCTSKRVDIILHGNHTHAHTHGVNRDHPLGIKKFSGVLPRCYLKDVECLKLDIGTFVSQQVHHELKVLWLADVPRHHGEVVSVQ